MGAARCAAPGCGRFVRRDAVLCGKHLTQYAASDESDDAPAPLESDEAALDFSRRLTEGDYRQLFGETLRDVIEQAAAAPGLTDEIGILRVVLARLMVVEHDPTRLAENVARVAGVAIQAARAQRAIGGVQPNELPGELMQALVTLDGGSGPS